LYIAVYVFIHVNRVLHVCNASECVHVYCFFLCCLYMFYCAASGVIHVNNVDDDDSFTVPQHMH